MKDDVGMAVGVESTTVVESSVVVRVGLVRVTVEIGGREVDEPAEASVVVTFAASEEVVVMSGDVNGTVDSSEMIVDCSTSSVVVMIGGGIVTMENGRSVVVKVGSDDGMSEDCSGVIEVVVKFELSFSVVAAFVDSVVVNSGGSNNVEFEFSVVAWLTN